jgi:hypothetical protein
VRNLWRILAAAAVVLIVAVPAPAHAQTEPPPEPPSCDVSLFDPGGAVECAIGWLGGIVGGVTEAVTNTAFSILVKLQEGWDTLTSALSSVGTAILGGITDMASSLWNRLGEVRDGISGRLTEVQAGISGRLTEVADWITAPIDAILEWALGLLDDLIDRLIDMAEDLVVPDTAHRTMLSDWWEETGDDSPAGLLVAAATLPADVITAVQSGIGSSCPGAMTLPGGAGSLDLCASVSAVTPYTTGVQTVVGAAIILAVVIALYRRIGDVIGGR